MNFAQIGIMSSIASRLDPDVAAWYNQVVADGGTAPSQNVLNALSVFINTPLSTGTIKSRMKTGYILHSGDTTVGRRNLKDPSTYRSSIVGALQFSEGNGTRSDGTTGYFSQPFKSNEYSGIQSDLTTIHYISESSAVGTFTNPSGFRVTAAGSVFYTFHPFADASGGAHYAFSATIRRFTSTNQKGLYVYLNNGTGSIVYKDGTKTTSAATAPSVPNISQNRLILAANTDVGSGVTPSGFYAKYMAVDFLFDQFNDADELSFRTAFNTYKTSVGLP